MKEFAGDHPDAEYVRHRLGATSVLRKNGLCPRGIWIANSQQQHPSRAIQVYCSYSRLFQPTDYYSLFVDRSSGTQGAMFLVIPGRRILLI